MKKIFSLFSLCLAAAILMALTATSARADIVYIPNEDSNAPRGGVGHRPESILSIQSPRNSTNASGGVRVVLSNGKKGGLVDENFGDAKNGEHTKTLTFAQAGITDAGRLRIYMDTEDQDNTIFVNDIILTAYSSTDGSILFQTSLIGPQSYLNEKNGQGKGDRTFGLTDDDAAKLQAAYLSDPNLRLGLFADTSTDTGSFTNFKLGQGPAPIPEPTTMLLLGTGLAGVAAKVRKRRKATKE